MKTSPQKEILHAKLNQETSQIPWQELLRYFASGIVISVADDLDLVEVAVHISNDDTAVVSCWMEENRLGKVSDEQAQTWLDKNVSLWTVVVKPWILVQEKKPGLQ